MPRMMAPQSEVVKKPQPTAIIASAVRMPGSSNRMWVRKEGWQSAAWKMYDEVGELRYAANWVGNVLSRATLHAAKRNSFGQVEPIITGPAADYLHDLFNGPDGQAQMLKSIGIHLFIAGECYLVGRAPIKARGEGKDDIWEIASTEEIKYGGGVWQIDYDDGLGPITLTDDDVVVRIWTPHPRKRILADSPVRAQLANLRELLLLSRHVSSQAVSHLAGAGVFFVPSEMSFAAPPGVDESLTSAESFQQVLGGAMSEAIDEPGSPAAITPIVVQAPGDQIGNVKHVTFWSEYDQNLPALRKESITRLATGLDIPAEVMLGTADMNHWSAWQVEESSIKVQVEPLLETITNALSIGYLQPTVGDVEVLVAFDTAQLRLRPNRSKEAVDLYDRGELNGPALRRETGFEEQDAMKPEDLKAWLLKKVAGGSATPEQVAQALNALGISEISAVGEEMREARPDPSTDDDRVQTGPPEREAASISDMSEVLVFRALERAGNRLRSLKQNRPPVPACDTYMFVECNVGDLDKVLEDAWGIIPRVMPNIASEQRQVVEAALDSYCRHLLLNKRQHSRSEMDHFLTSTSVRTLAS